MQEFEFIIQDEQGLHARPAGLLVKAAAQYPCHVSLTTGGKTVDAKRLFGVMGLAVKCGDTIKIACDGPQEQDAADSMRRLLEDSL